MLSSWNVRHPNASAFKRNIGCNNKIGNLGCIDSISKSDLISC